MSDRTRTFGEAMAEVVIAEEALRRVCREEVLGSSAKELVVAARATEYAAAADQALGVFLHSYTVATATQG